MKIAIVFGSPRKNGNTATMLKWIEEELIENGHEIERINIVDYNLHGCNGCMSCKENTDEPGCSQDDDGNAIFNKVAASDAIVVATPLYMWSYTSQTKKFIDRAACLVSGFNTSKHSSLVEDKKIALLVTCAGPKTLNADLITSEFNRWLWFLKVKENNDLIKIIPNCTVPEELGDDEKQIAMDLAYELIK